MKQLRIALIGSRELDKKIENHKYINQCYRVAYRLAELNVIFTSGLCKEGMDAYAQRAYSKALEEGKVTEKHFEVYVSNKEEIQQSPLPNAHLARVMNMARIDEITELAKSVVGHWHNCGPYARGMHQRNVHQILGYELNDPVDAVICWTPNGNVVGGTATALKLSMKAGIPIFNLGRPDNKEVLQEIADFLKGKVTPPNVVLPPSPRP